MKKRLVYVVGNPVVKEDRLPIDLIPRLRKEFAQIQFSRFDPTEEIKVYDGSIAIIDTVIGIRKVTKFNNLDKFLTSSRVSVHDFDLAIDLKLMQKLGKLKEILIIGIPKAGGIKNILSEVKKIIAESVI